MNSREQARFDAFKGASSFGINNVNDFKPASGTTKTKVQELFEALGTVADGEAAAKKNTVLGNLVRAILAQDSGTGDFRSGTTSKSVQRDGLIAVLRGLNKSAAAMATADQTPEIMDNFRMPHGTNDTVIVARARAFADAAGPLKAKFAALEHPVDFIEALRQRVVDFENADSDQGTGLQDQVGATASIDDLIDQGLVILKQLDAIMHNKYAPNPEKLAAWLTASNIQRPSVNAKAAANVQPSPNAKQEAAASTPAPAPQLPGTV